MASANPVVQAPAAPIKQQPQQQLPFRKATVERTEIQTTITGYNITSSQQPIEVTQEGTGYYFGTMLNPVATAAGNAATVAFQEDAPWSALASIILRDPTGQIINLPGFSLYLANLADSQYGVNFWDKSGDTANVYNAVTGSGATGGSFLFWLRVPAAINRRDLLGILGNQDRSVKYQLRTDIAASTSIYSTAPTTLPPITIGKVYESYSVPSPLGASGAQQITPPGFGTLQYHTQSLSPSAPVGGSTVNHYIQQLGNTLRYLILVWRSNGTRANAAANAPSNIQMTWGDMNQFNEPYSYRRAIMYERYGFDWPAGVLVYDALDDFGQHAGFEIGDDYINTQAVNQAQIQVTYPSGFASTNNSLTIITSELLMVGAPIMS